jgi:hypothetical protein
VNRLGKTYGVEQALARAGERSACWAAFPSRPTMRLVAARLFEQLTFTEGLWLFRFLGCGGLARTEGPVESDDHR